MKTVTQPRLFGTSEPVQEPEPYEPDPVDYTGDRLIFGIPLHVEHARRLALAGQLERAAGMLRRDALRARDLDAAAFSAGHEFNRWDRLTPATRDELVEWRAAARSALDTQFASWQAALQLGDMLQHIAAAVNLCDWHPLTAYAAHKYLEEVANEWLT